MKYLYLVTVAFFLIPQPAHSQMLKKLKYKIEEKADQVIDKAVDKTFDASDSPSRENSDSNPVKTSDNVSRGSSVTLAANLSNQYENTTESVSYGKLVNQSPKFAVSPCGDHAAILGLNGSRQTVYVDGHEGELFDEVFFATFLFSQKGGHYAYVASKNGNCMVVSDGTIIDTIECNQHILKTAQAQDHNYFEFNESGTTLVYVKQVIHEVPGHEGSIMTRLAISYNVVVINGVEGPPVSMNLSGKHKELKVRGEKVYYLATSPKYEGYQFDGVRLYIDNKNVSSFKNARNLIVSNDGHNYAFIAEYYDDKTDITSQSVIINGKNDGHYSSINPLEMNLETGTVYYKTYDTEAKVGTFKIGERKYLISQVGTPSPAQGDILARQNHFRLSPDGKRHAFISQKSGMTGRANKRVWIDGKPSLFYENITEFTFTGDSKHTVFIASNGGQHFVIVDEAELGPFDRANRIQISKNGGSYAFWARSNNKSFWYVNGKPVEGYTPDGNGEFAFSDDGTSYAFAALNSNRKSVVVVDGQERPHQLSQFFSPHNPRWTKSIISPKLAPFVFSSANNRLIYNTRVISRQSLVVDNKKIESGKGSDAFTYPIFSPDGNHYAYLYGENRPSQPSLWRLFIDGKPGPVVAEYFSENPNAIKFVDNNTVQIIGFLENELFKYTVSVSE